MFGSSVVGVVGPLAVRPGRGGCGLEEPCGGGYELSERVRRREGALHTLCFLVGIRHQEIQQNQVLSSKLKLSFACAGLTSQYRDPTVGRKYVATSKTI